MPKCSFGTAKMPECLFVAPFMAFSDGDKMPFLGQKCKNKCFVTKSCGDCIFREHLVNKKINVNCDFTHISRKKHYICNCRREDLGSIALQN